MKLLIFAVVISLCLTFWACICAAARADEEAQRMYEEYKQNLKKE